MKAEFDRTRTIDIIFYVLIALMILAICEFVKKCPFFELSETALIIRFIALLAAAGLLSLVWSAFNGEITVDESGVTVTTKFFGKAFSKKRISYCDIECTYCGVKSHYYKASATHFLNFTVKKKNGIKHIFSKIAGTSRSFDMKEFQEHIDEQPLQKLCNFINEQIETSV